MKKLLRLLVAVGIGILATAVACQSTPDAEHDEEESAAHHDEEESAARHDEEESAARHDEEESSTDHAESFTPGEGIRITVSRNGFDGTGQFHIEVEEGEEVEITFVYGDGDFSQNNPHVIGILALGLTTGVIDRQNPEETLHFTAAETGEIMFMCTQVDCVGHANLQAGTIDVE